MECLSVSQQRFASVIDDINREITKRGFLIDAAGEDTTKPEMRGSAAKAGLHQKQLLKEMRSQNFDVIRFATYRTACKLRFIQKKTKLNQIDIWNMIEAFRENGLNSIEAQQDLALSRLEAVLTTVFTQLNKRLPPSQQVNVNHCVALTVSWLLNTYDKESIGRVQAFAIKVALSHLCSGKLVDKLRYIFTQISDSSGHMTWNKFDEYLQDLLALPAGVFEGPSFGYTESAAYSCFDPNSKINVNDFLNVVMGIPGPRHLLWLPVLSRMAQVEAVVHPVQCEGCNRASFTGFRYKCQNCFKYNLCQDCFWRGRTSSGHSLDHQIKEYTIYRSNSRQLGHTLKKSFQCKPQTTELNIPHFPDAPEKTIDLSFIVPPTPLTLHDSSAVDHSFALSASTHSLHHGSVNEGCGIDDEHRLIARYAARLAADGFNASRSPTEIHFSFNGSNYEREMVAKLEAKNRNIMREIQRLHLEQEANVNDLNETETYNPTLLAELCILRQRKKELETCMSSLQESRKDLMVQLETLMKMLKNQRVSVESSPNSSPKSRSELSLSPPCAGAAPTGQHAGSVVGSDAGAAGSSVPCTPLDTCLTGVGGDIRQAFHTSFLSAAYLRILCSDLLMAADSVTCAMSSLVKELDADMKTEDVLHSLTASDDLEPWKDNLRWNHKQESDLITQLRVQQHNSDSSRTASDSEQEGYTAMEETDSYIRTDDESMLATDDAESCIRTDEEQSLCLKTDEDAELYDSNPREMTSSRYTTDEESYQQTDEESFIRTDEEEGGNTDWEESTQRWVNR